MKIILASVTNSVFFDAHCENKTRTGFLHLIHRQKIYRLTLAELSWRGEAIVYLGMCATVFQSQGVTRRRVAMPDNDGKLIPGASMTEWLRYEATSASAGEKEKPVLLGEREHGRDVRHAQYSVDLFAL